MKKNKIILTLALFGVLFAPSKPVATAYADTLTAYDAAKSHENWTLARTNFSSGEEGLRFAQTEMGTPDNHAISILEVPFENTSVFEISFQLKMDEYVASGRSANDVWAGVGIMGKPTFINWRNTIEEEPSPLTGFGPAKETPGLFTRFFNYSGDLRYEGSVYQENYHTMGEASTEAEIVDTWRLFEGNANASIDSEITLKLSFDKNEANEEFYNVYINGNNITPAGEASFIERDVIFPEGNIYLLLVMNTQEDDFNTLSEINVQSINQYSYLNTIDPGTSEEPTSTPPVSETGDSQVDSQPVSEDDDDQATGCFATTIIGSATITIAMTVFLGVLYYRRKKLIG